MVPHRAAAQVDGLEIQVHFAGADAGDIQEVIDETPGAYKPIDAVMTAQADLAYGLAGDDTLDLHEQERVMIERALEKFGGNRRRATIQRIAECLIERQRDYLVNGVQHLVPLTRAEVGELIGMHESTVSRATAEKYVMLPSGEVVPFSHFFTASRAHHAYVGGSTPGSMPTSSSKRSVAR